MLLVERLAPGGPMRHQKALISWLNLDWGQGYVLRFICSVCVVAWS